MNIRTSLSVGNHSLISNSFIEKKILFLFTKYPFSSLKKKTKTFPKTILTKTFQTKIPNIKERIKPIIKIKNINSILTKECKQVRFYTSAPTPPKSLYEILGVSKNATKEEIKDKYYELVKKNHPDIQKTEKDKKLAAEKLAEINNAFEILGNDEKRQNYDMEQSQSHSKFGFGFGANQDIFSGFNDFFRSFTGQAHTGTSNTAYGHANETGRRGEDIRVRLEVDFMEAVKGCTKEIRYPRNIRCEKCIGTGSEPGTKVTKCDTCKGTGYVVGSNGVFHYQSPCNVCHGTGKKIEKYCSKCKGTGLFTSKETLSLQIPQGIDSNQAIPFAQKGNQGIQGGEAGDLYVIISVRDHPVFVRVNYDLHIQVPLNISQAILGSKISIPTLDKDALVNTPPGVQDGSINILKGKGITGRASNPFNSSYFVTGDLIIHYKVNIPSHLSKEQKDLIEKFSRFEKKETPKATEEFRRKFQ